MSHPKVDIISTCTLRDLPCYLLAVDRIHQYFNTKAVYVFVPRTDVSVFKRHLGSRAIVLNEDHAIADWTRKKMDNLPHQVFPRLSGWYYQQLLKYSFAFHDVTDDYYLIWDADTIPLCPMEFFNGERMLFVPASEYHLPYFETYHNLLGEDPKRKFSFISQHQIIQKTVLREMLDTICARHPDADTWPKALLMNLANGYGNLFSEYETYGNYLKNHYPERVETRDIPWLRGGTKKYGYPPTEFLLQKLSHDYAFVTFEAQLGVVKRLFLKSRKKVLSILDRGSNLRD